MYTWDFGPKRVLLLCLCAFVLGIETALILTGVSQGRPTSDILLKNGLTAFAVILAAGNFAFSARKPASEPSEPQD